MFLTIEPLASTPSTPTSAPPALGRIALASLAACGLWQSTQEAWRVVRFNGFSAASCSELVVRTGCTLALLNSCDRSFPPMPPLWHTRQLSSAWANRNRRWCVPAACGAWQFSHPLAATVAYPPSGHGFFPAPFHVAPEFRCTDRCLLYTSDAAD